MGLEQLNKPARRKIHVFAGYIIHGRQAPYSPTHAPDYSDIVLAPHSTQYPPLPGVYTLYPYPSVMERSTPSRSFSTVAMLNILGVKTFVVGQPENDRPVQRQLDIPTIEVNQQGLLPAAPIVAGPSRKKTEYRAHPKRTITPRAFAIPPPVPAKSDKRLACPVPPPATRSISAPIVTEVNASPEMASVSRATRGQVVKARELAPSIARQHSFTSLRSAQPYTHPFTARSQVSPPIPIARDALYFKAPKARSVPVKASPPRLTSGGAYLDTIPQVTWQPPDTARIEYVEFEHYKNASRAERENLPRMVPIYHTSESTYDRHGREINYNPPEHSLDAWRKGCSGHIHQTLEEPVIDDCACAECEREEDWVHVDHATTGPNAGHPNGIVVTTSSVQTTHIAPKAALLSTPLRTTHIAPKATLLSTPLLDEVLSDCSPINLITHGYSDVFDHTLDLKDLEIRAKIQEPFYQHELPAQPMGSLDFLDYINAPEEIRAAIDLIKPPYRGAGTTPCPSRPNSLELPPRAPKPIQYGFHVELLGSDYFRDNLHETRDEAWRQLISCRAEYLRFLRPDQQSSKFDPHTTPQHSSTCRLVKEERSQHEAFKKKKNTTAAIDFLRAQRTLEVYEDSKRIRQRELEQLAREREEEELRELSMARERVETTTSTISTCAAPSLEIVTPATWASATAEDVSVDKRPGPSIKTPPVVLARTAPRSDESAESEIELLSPQDHSATERPISLISSVLGPPLNPNFRFPKPRSRPMLDMPGPSMLSVPMYTRDSPSLAPESSSGHDSFDPLIRPNTPIPPTPPSPDDTVPVMRDVDDWARRALVFDHLAGQSRSRTSARRVSYDLTTTLAQQHTGVPKPTAAFSRSVDFLLLAKPERQSSSSRSATPSASGTFMRSPKLTRRQSILNKFVGRKTPTPTYEPGYRPEEHVAPRGRLISTKSNPPPTVRSLAFFRRGNASTQTLPMLEPWVPPDTTNRFEVYERQLMQRDEEERKKSAAKKAADRWKTLRAEVKIKVSRYRERLDDMRTSRDGYP